MSHFLTSILNSSLTTKPQYESIVGNFSIGILRFFKKRTSLSNSVFFKKPDSKEDIFIERRG